MSIEERLQQFLSDKSRISAHPQSLVERLSSFLQVLRPMIRPEVQAAETTVSEAGAWLNRERLAAAIAALAPKLAETRQHGGEINVWQVAGLKRAEVRNAAVLAALWSPAGIGDRAASFLSGFLRRLRHPEALPSREELARGYVVRTEHCATGAATERVDITIEGESFVLAIEVKIGAGEGKEQLARYRESVEDWARNRCKRGAVILLAPFQTKVPGIIHADWRDVVSAARASLPAKPALFTHADRLIADFARHAAAFEGARR